jgi:hypothetical protein
MFTGFRHFTFALSQILGFLLLSVGMGILYSCVLPDTLNYKDWIHSIAVGVLIVFSFHAGSRNS